jgi:hypothetical protein
MGSDSTGARAAQTSIAQRVARAHAEIHELLDRLDGGAFELGRTRQMLEDLPVMLEEHFDDEERNGGLFDTLRSLRPAVDPALKSLVRDHRSILRALETLEGYLERLDRTEDAGEQQQQLALLRGETDLVARQIREHERAESRLTADILYSDEGGSG